MANLYITEQGAVLRKTGGRLIVDKKGRTLFEVPCRKLETVLIFGNVQFTTQALHELFKNGIELALFTRNGRLKGQLTSPFTKNVTLRIRQYEKFKDRHFKRRFSRKIVFGKLENALHLVQQYVKNHPDTPLTDELNTLRSFVDRVETANTPGELNGLEGSAAKTYFIAFAKMLRHGPAFPGRRKRPPTDPVNAVLSLSYTMIFNEISSLLDGIGFDPYIGFYHKPEYGRASLAADLMEEFRAPAADRLCLTLFNRGIFNETDFTPIAKTGGVSFTRNALKRYFKEYEHYITQPFIHPRTGTRTTIRKCYRDQAEQLASALQNNVDYEPFPHTEDAPKCAIS
jgi:CRISPR-associated protein Cas1